MLQKERFSSLAIDFVAVVCLALCTLKLTLGLDQLYDLSLHDETGYLSALLNHPPPYSPEMAGWGTLYSLWYRLLHHWVQEPVALFFINLKLLTFLTATSFFALLRVLRVGRTTALVFAFLMLISTCNLPTQPKIIHFALPILIVSWIVGNWRHKMGTGFLSVGLGCLIASYARPELTFSAYIACAALIGWLVWGSARRHLADREKIQLAGLALTLGSAIWLVHHWLGNPSVDGSRSWEAFGPLFSLNWVQWHHSALNPWTEWPVIIAKAFPHAHSHVGAFLENPGDVIKHTIWNLPELAGIYWEMLFAHFNIFLPSRWVLLKYTEKIAWVGLVGFCLFHCRHSFPASAGQLRKWLSSEAGLSLVLIFFPYFATTTLLFPRLHYVFPLCFLTFVAIAKFVDSNQIFPNVAVGWLFAGLLLLTPTINSPWTTGLTAGQPIRELIQFISTIPFETSHPKHVILETMGGLDVYLGDHFSRTSMEAKQTPMNTFLKTSDIDVIVIDDILSQNWRFQNDPLFHQFMATPEQFGFRAVGQIRDRQVLVRQDRLAKVEN